MRTYLITHDDLDGAACEVLVREALGYKDFEAYHTDYKKINKVLHDVLLKVESDPDSRLVITDICPEGDRTVSLIDRLDTLSLAKRDVMMFDHHKSSAVLDGRDWVVHSRVDCATKLVFEYYAHFAPTGVYKDFVDAVDSYDRWQLKSDTRARGEDLNRLYCFSGHEDFVESFTRTIETDKEIPDLIEDLRSKENRDVSQAVEESEDYNKVLRKDSQGRVYYLLPSRNP